MFEIRAEMDTDGSLKLIFPTLGYRLFRLLIGLPVLVPIVHGELVDSAELNIFAAKPDRAAMLAQAGLLVEVEVDWRPASDDARHHSLPLLMTQDFAAALKPLWKPVVRSIRIIATGALAAYEVWRRSDVPLPQRCAALDHAFHQMRLLCDRAANLARLSTFARIAWEAGKRGACARASRDFIKEMERGPIALSEPFWPACPRFDLIRPGGQVGNRFVASVVEQHERVRRYSSFFSDDASGLDWLCQQPFASIEMERRRALMAARTEGTVEVPERLRIDAAEHLNAEIWRSGAMLTR